MSFGFTDDDKTLENVINNTNTLMFAASSNFGATEDNSIRFPARMKHKVICIHAADGRGDPTSTNPQDNPKLENFSILGESVSLGKQKDLKTGEVQQLYKTGTSIATPIAAGIAALVLEFALQPGMHRKDKSDEEIKGFVDELKIFTGMSSIIRRMTKDGMKGGFNFVSPWKVLMGDPKLTERERFAQAANLRIGAICTTLSDTLREKYC